MSVPAAAPTITNANSERIEVIHSTENIIDTYLPALHNAKSRWDCFADVNSLAVPVLIKSIREALSRAKSTGIKLRFVTEITEGNISQCKEVVTIGEIRHLEGVKGNFAVSDTEYIAISCAAIAASSTTTRNSTESQPTTTATAVPHAVYSNVKEDVQQQQYVFEILWNKAIPAEQKLREIEEGVIHVRTRLLENRDEIINEIRCLNNNASKLSICSAFGGMQMAYNYLFDSYTKVVEKHRTGKGDGMRWIVNMDNKDSLDLVKTFLNEGIHVRHLKNMPPMNFGISNKEMAVTIEKMEGGNMSQSFLISSEPLYINHFNSLFDELWKNGIDAEDRIKDIEEGVDTDIEVVPNAATAREIYLNLVSHASEEILLILPTTKAFIRQEKIGIIIALREASKKRNVKVRILMPHADSLSEDKIQDLIQNRDKNIVIRNIEQTSGTKATILAVDKIVSLVMELRDDTKETFDEAIGSSTYSHSKAGVLSYVAIFENLWIQTELYQQISESSRRLELANEQLKIHDKMQQEFISIASHELRTPVQSILGFASLANKAQIEPIQACKGILLEAYKLQQLTNDLLDVSRIESGASLSYVMEKVRINEIILNIVNAIRVSLKQGVSIETGLGANIGGVGSGGIHDNSDNNKEIEIYADKIRIAQAISNIVGNAVKFTDRGIIRVESLVSVDKKRVEIKVCDSGNGIAEDILPNLFDKFVTKTPGNENKRGTGLGLYITKAIIDAHKGEIFAANNNQTVGATFTIVLPSV